MIVVHTSKTKRKFVVWKKLITEDGLAFASIWFQWMTRVDRDCASWLWISDDGQRFVEHIAH